MIDEYITQIPKYSEMKYWFYRDTKNNIHVSNTQGCGEIGVCLELSNNEIQIPAILAGKEADIKADWIKFKSRPEYVVGLVPTYHSEDDMELLYDKLVLGCSLIKLHQKLKSDPDSYIAKIKSKCIDWLHSTDFYDCPASTQYHDSQPKGLLKHTLNVVDSAVCLMSAYPFMNRVTCESVVLVCLVHDWCKIGLYKPYGRNVKNEATGKWESVLAYKYVENRTIALGHGVSSLYLTMKFFNLTIDEAAAIRWHMGRYNCVDAEINELQQANRSYPLVHLLQFADQLSITDYR